MRNSDLKHQAMIARVGAIVANVVRSRMALPSIPPEITLEDLCIDPLERVFIATAVESEWNVEFTDAEIESWLVLDDIVRSVVERSSGRGGR
jgi:hypothetical protein